MIELKEMENGNLLITLKNKEEFKELMEENNNYPNLWDILEFSKYNGNGWYDLTDRPEFGFLTNSLLIGFDVEMNNDGDFIPNKNDKIWWFPNYAIENEWLTLLNEGQVIFDRC